VALADATFIFPEADVQAPVQFVLHAPMATDVRQKPGSVVGRKVADVVAALRGSLAIDRSFGLDTNEASKVLPLGFLGEPVDLRRRPDPPLLDTPVSAVGGCGGAVGDAAAVVNGQLGSPLIYGSSPNQLPQFGL